MARPKIYTPKRYAQIAVQTSKSVKTTGFTASEASLTNPQINEAVKVGAIRPRMTKGSVVTRKTGTRGKPPVEYIPTIAARSMAKAA